MIWELVARLLARPAIADWLIERAQRTPYQHIYDPVTGELYMGRWWLFNPYPTDESVRKDQRFPISVRIHWIRRADTARDLHDHPWNARTIILKGGYRERRLLSNGTEAHFNRKPGHTAKINFGEYHTIESIEPDGAWTLFITGSYRGSWGFRVNGVKVPWRTYLGLPEKEQ